MNEVKSKEANALKRAQGVFALNFGPTNSRGRRGRQRLAESGIAKKYSTTTEKNAGTHCMWLSEYTAIDFKD